MKVQKVKRSGVGWTSSGGGSAEDLLMLCGGPKPPPVIPRRSVSPGGGASSSSHESSGMVAVGSLESSFAELKSLTVDYQAETWSGRKLG